MRKACATLAPAFIFEAATRSVGQLLPVDRVAETYGRSGMRAGHGKGAAARTLRRVLARTVEGGHS